MYLTTVCLTGRESTETDVKITQHARRPSRLAGPPCKMHKVLCLPLRKEEVGAQQTAGSMCVCLLSDELYMNSSHVNAPRANQIDMANCFVS